MRGRPPSLVATQGLALLPPPECRTLSYMGTTITIRTESGLRSLLEDRAAATGKSISEVVREILENALAERPVGERTGHLKAQLHLPSRSVELWRKRLRARNWRP